jgi:hypothetical protein
MEMRSEGSVPWPTDDTREPLVPLYDIRQPRDVGLGHGSAQIRPTPDS